MQLPSLGIQQNFITFTNVTLESDKFVCVRETAPQNQLVSYLALETHCMAC